jgi:hypothetical protein
LVPEPLSPELPPVVLFPSDVLLLSELQAVSPSVSVANAIPKANTVRVESIVSPCVDE